jgi:hypothetical protein
LFENWWASGTGDKLNFLNELNSLDKLKIWYSNILQTDLNTNVLNLQKGWLWNGAWTLSTWVTDAVNANKAKSWETKDWERWYDEFKNLKDVDKYATIFENRYSNTFSNWLLAPANNKPNNKNEWEIWFARRFTEGDNTPEKTYIGNADKDIYLMFPCSGQSNDPYAAELFVVLIQKLIKDSLTRENPLDFIQAMFLLYK